jgi:hypothetical protein
MLQKLLELIAWLNASPGRKRALTLGLVGLGQLLRRVGPIQGVPVGDLGDQVLSTLIVFIQTDMVPLVDILTLLMGGIALWHPASRAAAKAVGVPPPTEAPVIAVPESFEVAKVPAPPSTQSMKARITQGPGFRG